MPGGRPEGCTAGRHAAAAWQCARATACRHPPAPHLVHASVRARRRAQPLLLLRLARGFCGHHHHREARPRRQVAQRLRHLAPLLRARGVRQVADQHQRGQQAGRQAPRPLLRLLRLLRLLLAARGRPAPRRRPSPRRRALAGAGRRRRGSATAAAAAQGEVGHLGARHKLVELVDLGPAGRQHRGRRRQAATPGLSANGACEARIGSDERRPRRTRLFACRLRRPQTSGRQCAHARSSPRTCAPCPRTAPPPTPPRWAAATR